MPLKLNGSTSGYVIVDAPAVAGTTTISLPAVSGGSFVVSDSFGNVGIGTSSPANPIQTYKLGAYSASSNNIRNMAYFQADATVSNSSIIFDTNPSAGHNLRGFRFGYQSSDFSITRFHTDKTTGAINDLTIDSSGNVGIGTISPTRLVTLGGSGDQYINRSSDTGSLILCGGIGINSGASQFSGAFVARGGTSSYNQGGVEIYTNAQERMRIDTSGNVLIGTSSTTGSSYTPYVVGGKGYASRSGGNGSYNATIWNLNYTSGNMQLWVDASNIGNISTTSDYRIKKNVASQIESGLERINKLRPVTYEFTENVQFPFVKSDGIIHEGFIAHEVAEVIASAVVGEKDAENQIQSLKLDALCSVLVKAVQELAAKVDAQAAEIASLKAKVGA